MIVNLTRHPITFILSDGSYVEVEPEGRAARVGSRTVEDLRVTVHKSATIPVYRMVDRELLDLPDPKEGVIYVVSGLVAAVAKRPDVGSPVRLQRDNLGRVVGIQGLLHYAEKEGGDP